ncbi:hypothetical protein BpHYR1_001342 [Brachionus plicatilis]|uniref:Uncharacterized protein n=1 Tax=Brachionus plicatilis TaxID=10195 RepID=A0A3M7QAN8_BRAPC|nr:hypothetical protein BpHYR1_001342 [Brachionus plicatilis]
MWTALKAYTHRRP